MKQLSSKPARGTQDLLPEDMKLRNWVISKITEVYTSRGYTQIETPIIENIENLTASEGGENLRMLFKILKRGEKLDLKNIKSEDDLTNLGLRFDLTLPLSRFYSNNLNELIRPFKAFQLGNVFRAERNQKGRYRQFVQCDIDTLGDSSYFAETDLLITVPEALYNIGFKNFTIKINDRRILKELVLKSGFEEDDFGTICITADKLDKIGREGVIAELKDKGYDETKAQKLLENLKTPLSEIEGEYAEQMCQIINTVKNYYPIEFDSTLVRGMGYYTGPIFEIVSGDFNSSIAGGGRYDGLLNKFTKESIPAVGFSIGFERVISILKEQGFKVPTQKTEYAVLFADEKLYGLALKFADERIKEGNIASIYKIKPNRIGKEVATFKKAGYETLVIDEINKN